jgi:hypothetical protein
MNPIDKLIKVLAVEKEPESCSAIRSKYSECKRNIIACMAEGTRRVNESKWLGNNTAISAFTWSWDSCTTSICKESTLEKIPAGSTTVNPGGGDGGFQRGRGNGAAQPSVLTTAPPTRGPDEPRRDYNKELRIEKNKRLCAISKDNLNRRFSSEVAEQKELFKAGCIPYLITTTGGSPNQTAAEAKRKKKLEDKINKITSDYMKQMDKLLKSKTCTDK